MQNSIEFDDDVRKLKKQKTKTQTHTHNFSNDN